MGPTIKALESGQLSTISDLACSVAEWDLYRLTQSGPYATADLGPMLLKSTA
jgi:hypothetical protein